MFIKIMDTCNQRLGFFSGYAKMESPTLFTRRCSSIKDFFYRFAIVRSFSFASVGMA